MSNSPETDFDLDLHFLPAWAQESPSVNRFAQFEQPREAARRERGRSRPPRKDREEGRGRFEKGRPLRRSRQEQPREQKEVPLPEVKVNFIPDESGVDSLARQIKLTGRAYPLFGIAQMILAKPERHEVVFEVVKKPDGSVEQPLFLVALDDSLWLSEAEAVQHVLDQHFATFYQPERQPVDPPKGVYTFVAQCGMSGAILGPPNYHDYQNKLRKLHAERFSRMPFEAYKSRVRIVKDEAIVKKWLEEQSFKTTYVCLNVPEPVTLANRHEVEEHFRTVHRPNIIRTVESHRVGGAASRSLRCHPLQRLVRQAWEQQRKFPLQVATVLSQQFATRGLQFFKVNKTITHVAVARPHYLDLEAIPVSEGVKRIVEYIDAHPKCTHRRLLDALVPAKPAPQSPPPTPVPAEPPAAGEPQEAGAVADATAAAPSAEQPSSEAMAVSTDLHWLIHQGHVIEFADGTLETAKKPAIKPPKPAPAVEPAAPAPSTEGITVRAETESTPVKEDSPAETVAQTETPVEDTAPAPSSDAAATSPEAPPAAEITEARPVAENATSPKSAPPAGEAPAQDSPEPDQPPGGQPPPAEDKPSV